MTVVAHTLIGARAPIREDGTPWTHVIIEEAETETGPWTPLDTQELDPLDAVPAEPKRRNISFETTTTNAWFRLTFRIPEADENSAPSDPVFDDGRAPTIDWQPTVEEVASLIPARTKERGGGEVGTFTMLTKPKRPAVERLIILGTRRIRSKIGGNPCNEDLQDDARGTAALYVAMLVEQGYYPEQTQAAGSSFNSLEKLFKPQLNDLAEAVAEVCGEGEGGEGGGGGAHARPVGNFDNRELIGPNGPDW